MAVQESADIQRGDGVYLFFKFVRITVDLLTNTLPNLGQIQLSYQRDDFAVGKPLSFVKKNNDYRYHNCYIDLHATTHKSTEVDGKTHTQGRDSN